MAGPVGPIQLKIGDKVGNFVVKKKVGEGACGQVFLCHMTKDGRVTRCAMKVEPRMTKKEDEILRMEIFVLSRLQRSHHVPILMASGQRPTFTFVVMTLLGREVFEIRRRLPLRKMQTSTVLRIALQLFRGFQEIHESGFVHRDVKPSNMAVGYKNPMVIYIFDFGLARQILLDEKGGHRASKGLRPPRSKVMFRGTVRYCSLNVHRAKEQGRHDDLYGVLFSLLECLTGTLPWKGKRRKDAEKIKATTTEEVLCKDCPPSFLEIAKKLKTLTYADTPPYAAFMQTVKKDIPKGVKMTDPYEWMKVDRQSGQVVTEDHWDEAGPKKDPSDKEPAEVDKADNADQGTNRDVEDSVVTEDKESTHEFDPDMSKEDTLDNI